MYKPFHLIGLELNISILSAALRNQPTGAPICFNADAVAVGALPIGLASDVTVTRAIKSGEVVTMSDLSADTSAQAWRVRGAMVERFGLIVGGGIVSIRR